VRALVDSNGPLHTRLEDTPSGVAMHAKAADFNGDGALNFNDVMAFLAAFNSGTPLVPGDTGYDPDADLSADGFSTIFLSEYTPFLSRYNACSGGGSPSFNAGWIDNPSGPNGPDNSIGYGGYVFDLAGATEMTSTGLYMVRHRVYDPKLGRWLQRDPLEYVDGTGLHNYTGKSPTNAQDLTGLYRLILRVPSYVELCLKLIEGRVSPYRTSKHLEAICKYSVPVPGRVARPPSSAHQFPAHSLARPTPISILKVHWPQTVQATPHLNALNHRTKRRMDLSRTA
jgi:RHS repeat-associated protein